MHFSTIFSSTNGESDKVNSMIRSTTIFTHYNL